MTPPVRKRTTRTWLSIAVVVLATAVVVIVVVVIAALVRHRTPPEGSLPLRPIGEIALPGDSSRFDYAGLDAARGLLFVAHLGASEIIEIDAHTGTVVRTIPGDGLAYDPVHNTVWTTNESGGSETVINADTGQVQGTVQVGGEAGNVAYDPQSQQMLVDVQTSNQLAVIDPTTLAVTRQVPLPGCDHAHGLAIDSVHRVAFVACDANAALLTVDLNTWQVVGTQQVGDNPDVLAYDPTAGRLYVAAESGWVWA